MPALAVPAHNAQCIIERVDDVRAQQAPMHRLFLAHHTAGYFAYFQCGDLYSFWRFGVRALLGAFDFDAPIAHLHPSRVRRAFARQCR